MPFLEKETFHWTSRKVFGQRRPRSTLWVPSGPMDAPNGREAPGANPDGLHCGPARRTWARVRLCTDAHHGAVHHEPARAPPWLPAARQVPLGPLGTAPPLVDLALAVSEFAGARRVQTGPQGLRIHFLHFSSIHRGCSATCGLSKHPCGRLRLVVKVLERLEGCLKNRFFGLPILVLFSAKTTNRRPARPAL